MVKKKTATGSGGGPRRTTTTRTSAPTTKKPIATATKGTVAVRKMRQPLRKRR